MNCKGIFSKKSDEWSTPIDLFNALNNIFHFTLDPCCTIENHLCKKFFTINEDGLKQSWFKEVVFCNPHYSNVSEWVKYCYDQWFFNKAEIVLLVPARTDTKWFHECIYHEHNIEIVFLRGRLKFGSSKNSAPFPSMLVYFPQNKHLPFSNLRL